MPLKQAAAKVQAALNKTSVNEGQTLFFDHSTEWFAPLAALEMTPYSSNMTGVKQIDVLDEEQVASA